jgi:hypothetical protein
MCRNIRTLFNFEPPATDEEIRASALQFVRKLRGFNKPSKAIRKKIDPEDRKGVLSFVVRRAARHRRHADLYDWDESKRVLCVPLLEFLLAF